MKTLAYGHIKAAVRSVRSNKSRSILTMLGVVVGVVSVVSIVSIGEGVKHQIRLQINHYGRDLITVRPGAPSGNGALDSISSLVNVHQTGSLTSSDLQAASKTKGVEFTAPVAVVGGAVGGGDQPAGSVTVIGTTNRFADALHQKIAFGANFDPNNKQAPTAILGSRVAERMFDDPVPLGRSFTIRGQEFNVAGIFDDFATAPFSADVNFNNAIFIPLDTAQSITSSSAPIYEILVQPIASHGQPDDHLVKTLQRNIAAERGGQTDFTVLTHAESASVTNNILNLLTALIGGVAAVSLLVGGVGIMNIMLVSVTERMHEIGIRKAVGATNRQILMQFVTEAAVLSLSGGIIGILLAYGIDMILRITTNLQPIISWQVVAVALLVSLLVGAIFGSAPALKAARKDPINALRNE